MYLDPPHEDVTPEELLAAAEKRQEQRAIHFQWLLITSYGVGLALIVAWLIRSL
jgi:hypothetical protein